MNFARFALVFCLFASPIALADSPSVSSDPYLDLHGQNLYDQLSKDFDTATLPTQTELQGWWAGRCVTPSRKNKEHGFVLTFRKDAAGELYMGTVYVKGEHNPAAYDQINASQAASIEAYLDTHQARDIHPAFEESGSIASVGQASFWTDHGSSYTRKTSDSFVEKLEFQISGTWMCYFFKQVK